ncbi:MAG: alpha-D-ribose 1-methylphosphonate 5-triphosphate diphosphatase [Pseudomonadota bacterium]
MDQPSLRLTGGRVLGPQRLQTQDLVISGGRFAAPEAEAGRSLAVDGLWLLPGIIDLHGDAFERALAPRRGVITNLSRGLLAVETDLAAAGITTAWLAQFWSWEGGMRAPEFARRLAAALRDVKLALRVDMRLQLRLERTMIDDLDAVAAFVRAEGIDYVVFNDHIPHDRLAEGRTPPRLSGSAAKAGRAPEAHLALMRSLSDRAHEVPPAVDALARKLRAEGVRLGAHDDVDRDARLLWGDMGLAIAEFPVTRPAAEAARARKEPVIMGAPNIVRGGSHKRGGMSAEALVTSGLVDALASDYHYPALSEAAFALVDRGRLSLPVAWGLVSAAPARIMGLTDRGRIEPGLRADLIVFDPDARRILGTFVGGRPVVLQGRLADALVEAHR